MVCNEQFLVVHDAQVHQVEGGVQRLLDVGDLVIAGGVGGGATQARVGGVGWPLGAHLPALKASPTAYSFGLEHTREVYYCLVLPDDTPVESLSALERVLAASCALGSVGDPATPAPPGAMVDVPGAPAAAAGATGTGAAVVGGGREDDDVMSCVSDRDAEGPEEAAARGDWNAAEVVAALAPAACGPQQQQPQQQQQQQQQEREQQEEGGEPWRPEREAGGAAPSGTGTRADADADAIAGDTGHPREPTAADRVAAGILIGGSALASLVRRASGSASSAVARFAEGRIAQAQRMGPPASVPPHVQQGLQVASAAASTAAAVTGAAAVAVGEVSYVLAQRIAEAAARRRERRRRGGASGGTSPPRGPGAPGSGSAGAGSRRARRHAARPGGACDEGLKTVGAASMLAAVQVYDALEEAAKLVLGQGAASGARYVGARYGPEAAAAASRGVPVANDVVAAVRRCASPPKVANVARLASTRALVSHEAQARRAPARSAASHLHAALYPGAGAAPGAAATADAAAAAAPAAAAARPPAALEMRAMP